jgi:regulatory protein
VAFNLALGFLASRARSEAEIAGYLIGKGIAPAAAGQILEKLRALGYADDRSFARDWACARAQSRGYGPQRITQELRAKGISESLIAEAVGAAFGGGREGHQARELLHKRFDRAALRDPKTVRRAAAFLQRRGYNETVISEILELDEN